MKTRLLKIAVAALTAVMLDSCSKINERIDDLYKMVTTLENDKIASIDQQVDGIKASINNLKATDAIINGKIEEIKSTAESHQSLIDALKQVDNVLGQKNEELEGCIATLVGQVRTINEQIETLINADKAINGKIDELKTYIDTEIGNAKDWATATFATLEQYQHTADDLATLSVTVSGISTTLAEVQTSIAKLDAKLDGIDSVLHGKITDAKTELEDKIGSLKAELETKIKDAIDASETSVKVWVNGLLEGYYNIAEVDAKISALNDAINASLGASKERADSMATELTTLKTAVDTAKANIRNEYRNAIATAINKLDGEIRGAPKDSILAVNGRIAVLDTRVKSLESRMLGVEGKVDKLLAMIQTVSITPTYSDGSVEAVDGILTLKCIVSPAEALSGMESLKDSLLIYADSVKVKTKSASAYMEIKVSEASVIDVNQGAITLKADISEYLPKGIDKALTVALNITNGISKYTTEFVGVTGNNSPTYGMKFAKAVYSEYGGAYWEFKLGKTDGDRGYPILRITAGPVYSGEFIEGEFAVKTAELKTSATESTDYTGGTVTITCTKSGTTSAAGEYSYTIKTKDASSNDVEFTAIGISTSATDATGAAVTLKDKSASDPDRKAVIGISFPESYAPEVSIGETTRLTLTVNPEDATTPYAYWSSSDKSVATIDSFGNVRGIGLGTSTITATSVDGKKTATCPITVNGLFNCLVPGTKLFIGGEGVADVDKDHHMTYLPSIDYHADRTVAAHFSDFCSYKNNFGTIPKAEAFNSWKGYDTTTDTWTSYFDYEIFVKLEAGKDVYFADAEKKIYFALDTVFTYKDNAATATPPTVSVGGKTTMMASTSPIAFKVPKDGVYRIRFNSSNQEAYLSRIGQTPQNSSFPGLGKVAFRVWPNPKDCPIYVAPAEGVEEQGYLGHGEFKTTINASDYETIVLNDGSTGCGYKFLFGGLDNDQPYGRQYIGEVYVAWDPQTTPTAPKYWTIVPVQGGAWNKQHNAEDVSLPNGTWDLPAELIGKDFEVTICFNDKYGAYCHYFKAIISRQIAPPF